MIYWNVDLMPEEIMTGVPGWNKVSRFTLCVFEDLGYFIADYTQSDHFNFLRNDLVAKTGAGNTLPMTIPINAASGIAATINA